LPNPLQELHFGVFDRQLASKLHYNYVYADKTDAFKEAQAIVEQHRA